MKITILGSGNMAHFFVTKLRAQGHLIHQIYTPSAGHGALLGQHAATPVIHDLEELSPEADAFILAVKDDAIESVASRLPVAGKLIVHCAGSVSLNVLKNAPDRAVIWPVYSLNKEHLPHQRNIPVIVEGSNSHSIDLASQIASALSTQVTVTDYDQRKKLHLAAVVANNFINHLLTVSKSIVAGGNIPFDVLRPIIEQTFENAFRYTPERSQTGPAIRHDDRTIAHHLLLLENQPQIQQLYEVLTSAIQQFYQSPNHRSLHE